MASDARRDKWALVSVQDRKHPVLWTPEDESAISASTRTWMMRQCGFQPPFQLWASKAIIKFIQWAVLETEVLLPVSAFFSGSNGGIQRELMATLGITHKTIASDQIQKATRVFLLVVKGAATFGDDTSNVLKEGTALLSPALGKVGKICCEPDSCILPLVFSTNYQQSANFSLYDAYAQCEFVKIRSAGKESGPKYKLLSTVAPDVYRKQWKEGMVLMKNNSILKKTVLLMTGKTLPGGNWKNYKELSNTNILDGPSYRRFLMEFFQQTSTLPSNMNECLETRTEPGTVDHVSDLLLESVQCSIGLLEDEEFLSEGNIFDILISYARKN